MSKIEDIAWKIAEIPFTIIDWLHDIAHNEEFDTDYEREE